MIKHISLLWKHRVEKGSVRLRRVGNLQRAIVKAESCRLKEENCVLGEDTRARKAPKT